MIHFFFLDREPTLFVVLHLISRTYCSDELIEFVTTTRGCWKEKLSLIPSTKLIIEDYSLLVNDTIIPKETLAVHLSWKTKLDLATISELLNKRWMTLDLLSILEEAKRTSPIKTIFISENEFHRDNFEYPHYTFVVQENLSCLPRLREDEQKSESTDQL